MAIFATRKVLTAEKDKESEYNPGFQKGPTQGDPRKRFNLYLL